MIDVVVVPTGTANLASVLAGLRAAGAEPRVGSTAADVARAPAVVLPGVGAFAAAQAAIAEANLIGPLVDRLVTRRPTLGICLGLQLLCAASEESPGVAGLGVLPGTVRRFPGGVRVPQLGWNAVAPGDGCRLLRPGYAYYANSYRLVEPPAGWDTALTDHAGPFVAAVEDGPVLACQFHPELSGEWGIALLARWLAAAAET